MSTGFITPAAIHCACLAAAFALRSPALTTLPADVRNHGAAPACSWETHRVALNGNISGGERVYSMEDIVAMPSHELPVLLVCAGNRRKEENMLKQTIGFSWGPSAAATSQWKGVPLWRMLHAVGITEPTEAAQYVCFRGPVKELPKGDDGSYGTSIPMHMALDPAADVLIAYEQNGARLSVDHGFPVRVIIPGWIGGRMIKWLVEIKVTSTPSDNFYHFNDNRILPPEIDAERASAEGWWYKPEYIFNELNINSAIASPAHDEVLRIERAANTQPYTMRGYAYTGGGRAVTRVEVSVDGGITWQLAKLTSTAKPTKYGRHWCWVFWELEVDARALLLTRELCCRAWDAGNNTQPRAITWNVMGMGNNCYFTVRVHPEPTADGGIALRFEHPTEPGALKGGWMGNTAGGWKPDAPPLPMLGAAAAPPAEAAAPAGAGSAHVPVKSNGKVFTMAQVAQHSSEADCWIVVAGKVYDTTAFNKSHPGGGSSIFINAGTDTTEEFEAIHSKRAWSMLDDYYIGDLAPPSADAPPTPPPTPLETQAMRTSLDLARAAAHSWDGPLALDPKQRLPFKLLERTELNHNTRLLRFALQSPKHVLGLPVGQHVFVSASIGGRLVMRAYTPVSVNADKGVFDLLIKVYFRGTDPEFPLGGAMSQHLDTLRPGDTIDVKGPLGHIDYLGRGAFDISSAKVRVTRVAMVAGGTGITPMYQLLRAMLDDSADTTRIWLLYANRSEDDILLAAELGALAAAHPTRFTLVHTLSRPSAAWTGCTGRVSAEMVTKHMPPALVDGDAALAFLCGPGGLQDSCYRHFYALGYPDERVLTF